jgi:hypothetical protein
MAGSFGSGAVEQTAAISTQLAKWCYFTQRKPVWLVGDSLSWEWRAAGR